MCGGEWGGNWLCFCLYSSNLLKYFCESRVGKSAPGGLEAFFFPSGPLKECQGEFFIKECVGDTCVWLVR